MPATKSLQELIIAVHFDVPIVLAVVDLADWVTHFSGEYPVVQQLPALPQIVLPVATAPQLLQLQMLSVDSQPLPRMLLRSTDGRYSVQLQSDRFAFGWHRTEPVGEPAAYAGFEAHQRSWAEMLAKFEEWTQARFRQRPGHRMVELTYSNATPLEKDGEKKRISEIFRFVQPGSRTLTSFNTTWTESVYPRSATEPPKALVSAQVAVGSAAPAQTVLAFTFTGIGAVAENEESKHILNDIHAKIREMYEGSIVTDAD
jgi:uncharacterized protein (TIGR04255 family)